ncbi:MAG: hypothetical protein ACTSVI_02175 [Promethearchaeota archaeon]
MKDLRNEDIALRYQISKSLNQNNNHIQNAPREHQKANFNSPRHHPESFSFDDDEEFEGAAILGRVNSMIRVNIITNLLFLGFFVSVDVLVLLFSSGINYVFAIIPVLIHAIFFPWVSVFGYRLLKKKVPMALFHVKFVKVTIIYLIVYSTARMVLSIIIPNFIIFVLFFLILIQSVVTWIRLTRNSKMIL